MPSAQDQQEMASLLLGWGLCSKLPSRASPDLQEPQQLLLPGCMPWCSGGDRSLGAGTDLRSAWERTGAWSVSLNPMRDWEAPRSCGAVSLAVAAAGGRSGALSQLGWQGVYGGSP